MPLTVQDVRRHFSKNTMEPKSYEEELKFFELVKSVVESEKSVAMDDLRENIRRLATSFGEKNDKSSK